MRGVLVLLGARRLAWAAMAVGLAAGAYAQPAPGAAEPRVVLRGVVVDAAGTPLPRVRMDARAGAVIVASVLTDDRGEFALPLAPAPVSVKAAKAGYAAVALPIAADDLRAPAPLRITMRRGAVIGGRFLTSRGDVPTIPLVVRRDGARPEPPAAGAPRVTLPLDLMTSPDVTAAEFMVRADDRGEFRIAGLSPGRYALEPLRSDMLRAAGLRAETTMVDVQEGAEVAGLEVVVGDPPRPDFVRRPQPVTGTAAVRGRVLTTGGQPIAGADVTVGPGRPSVYAVSTSTDAFGRYEARGLAAGSYNVVVTKNQYLRTQHGGSPSGLPPLPLVLGDGQQLNDVDLVMPRSSVVAGAVFDENGEPVQDAAVQLLRVSRTRSGSSAARPQGAVAERTDDRGYFRVSGVTPGTYVLMVSVPAETVAVGTGLRMAYATTYYPGTADFASATPIDIASEEDLPGLSVVLRRVPVAPVTGVIVNSQGLPFAGTVRLMPQPLGNIRLEARVVHPDRDGSFAFSDVPAGQYVLQAVAMPGSGGPEFATAAVVIADSAPAPVALRTSPGSSIAGRFVLKGAPGGQPLWGYSMGAVAVDGVTTPSSTSTVSGAISEGHEFRLSPLAGSTRLRFSSPDENWFLESLVIQGVDIADVPFEFPVDGSFTDVEVVFSRTAAALTGTAADERGAAVGDYAAIAFSTDRSKWFEGSRWLKMARAGADGTFRVGGLPPGEYWIAAVERIPGTATNGEWQDPVLLETLSARAIRATLGPSDVHAVALRRIDSNTR